MAEVIASSRRQLELRILRCNPREDGAAAHFQSFYIEEADAMTLYIALTEIREQLDPSVQFDFV
ncbi:MAG: fumarate reductase iron-sulfur subunit, partial [Halieaceae bacterium]|nr:fumarate reductase iron-sulfur subunit [Halieaceae bacterium]